MLCGVTYMPSPNSSLTISLILSPKCMTASFNLLKEHNNQIKYEMQQHKAFRKALPNRSGLQLTHYYMLLPK